MSVKPLDLQVIFSKASDHAREIAKHNSSHDNAVFNELAKSNEKSINADKTIQKTNENESENNTILHDKESNQGNQGQKKHFSHQNPDENSQPKKAMLEEGKGSIIDIID